MRPGHLLWSSFLLCIVVLMAAIPALAMPPLPSSFYGTVKINGANAPDGTVIQAVIGGQVFAAVTTRTSQDSSVYSMDIPGDDASTPTLEGGRPGDTIVFRIGEGVAAQTGTWQSGTNVQLDLTLGPKREARAFLPILSR